MALAKLWADEQEGHMRPVRQVSEPSITKPWILRAEVNDTVVQGQFMFLSGEICLTSDR